MAALIITAILFVSMLVFLTTGLPIAFVLLSLGALFSLFLWGSNSLPMLASALLSQGGTIIMLAVPMFIFMGSMLERSGLAENLYKTMHMWFGGIRGGLAIGTILICTLFAAMTGISATACVTMAMIALPVMLSKGYDKSMAFGSIGAGSSLGILIPPSVPFVLYAQWAQESVGRLLMSGFIPGFMLSGLFVVYVLIRTWLDPSLCPALPVEERVGWKEKFNSLKYVILPILLVVLVLGVIFTGFATPTEAAAVGAFGTIIISAAHRRLTLQNLKESCYVTLKITSLALWIAVGAYAFASVYQALGAIQAIEAVVKALPVNRWVILAGIEFYLLVLGCLLDVVGIIMISCPIIIPVIRALGFDPIWFGCVFVITLEIGYLTPPFGFNIFYLKALAPKGTNIGDIYRYLFPWVGVMLVGLIITILFPELSLFLPSLMK